MFKVAIHSQWLLRGPDGNPLAQRLMALLVGIQRAGSLAAACRAAGLSYRYAWGLLREAERAFGRALVTSQRGQGAQLTALGERIAWADQRIGARLAPLLDSLASEVEAEIEQALAPDPAVLRLQASHGFAVETLRRFLASRQIPIDLRYRSCDEALTAFIDHQCDLIGLHLPIGALAEPASAHYRPRIAPDWTAIHVANRRQGLIVASGNPRRIAGIGDLVHRGLRFVNRQVGTGTRLVFDLLLRQAGIDPHAIDGYENVEFTHAAVAAYVGSGMADVGFGLEVPARRFGLDFVPLVSERYFFVCRDAFLEAPALHAVDGILRETPFRHEVALLPGYDPREAGAREPALATFGATRTRRGVRTAAATTGRA